tara:strand:- start:464 stop:649 length:186 start_codon:yes stop_codon:yes gene_type:complete
MVGGGRMTFLCRDDQGMHHLARVKFVTRANGDEEFYIIDSEGTIQLDWIPVVEAKITCNLA